MILTVLLSLQDDVYEFVAAAEVLKQYGAYRVYVLATHGLLSSDSPRLIEDSQIDEVVVSFRSISRRLTRLSSSCSFHRELLIEHSFSSLTPGDKYGATRSTKAPMFKDQNDRHFGFVGGGDSQNTQQGVDVRAVQECHPRRLGFFGANHCRIVTTKLENRRQAYWRAWSHYLTRVITQKLSREK